MEKHRNWNLPWGHWLHADGREPGPLVDEEGRRWTSVREAFWIGRLGMREQFMQEDLERLVAVLATYDRRRVPIAESVHDLFGGERHFAGFYNRWLRAQGLTVGTGAHGEALSAEGASALVMLAATRPSRVRYVPVGLQAIATMIPADPSDPVVEAWLDRVETVARHLPFRFVRSDLWGAPAVALIGDGLGGEVPIRRTIWTQSFSDGESRDRFAIWLATRLDRWEQWGRLGHERGAPVLTQHLLATFVAGDGADGTRRKGRRTLA